MKTLLRLVCCLALLGTLAARETSHAQLVLSDGRTFAEAKIVSDTALTVVIQVGKRIHQVDKKLLPADVLAQWPVDEARAAADAATVQRKASEKADAIERAKQINEAGRQEQIAKAIAYAEKNKPRPLSPEEAEALRKKVAAQNSGIYDAGLLLRGAVSSFGQVYVMIRNQTASPVKFDYSSLILVSRDGAQTMPCAGIVVDQGEVVDQFIPANQWRVFRLAQTSRMEVGVVHWKDNPSPLPVQQLYRQGNQVSMGSEYDKQRADIWRAEQEGREFIDDSEVTQILIGYTRPSRPDALRKK